MSSAKRPAITMHVVSSLDGFIARKDNTISWLEGHDDVYEAGVPEGGVDEPVKVDCYVLGSRTYEDALGFGWPYGDTPTIVLTNRELSSTRASVEFHSGDLKRLVGDTLAPRYENIWVVGGAMLCQQFLELGLVDEIRVTVAPILLGDGLRLFSTSPLESRWRLNGVAAYKNGFVDLRYGRPPIARD
jgi:dihydrofolate reductase